jgi:hypothetical protein
MGALPPCRGRPRRRAVLLHLHPSRMARPAGCRLRPWPNARILPGLPPPRGRRHLYIRTPYFTFDVPIELWNCGSGPVGLSGRRKPMRLLHLREMLQRASVIASPPAIGLNRRSSSRQAAKPRRRTSGIAVSIRRVATAGCHHLSWRGAGQPNGPDESWPSAKLSVRRVRMNEATPGAREAGRRPWRRSGWQPIQARCPTT